MISELAHIITVFFAVLASSFLAFDCKRRLGELDLIAKVPFIQPWSVPLSEIQRRIAAEWRYKGMASASLHWRSFPGFAG